MIIDVYKVIDSTIYSLNGTDLAKLSNIIADFKKKL